MDSQSEVLIGDESLAYRSFGEMFPVLMVLVDAEMRVRWASPGSRIVLGFEPDEMVGRFIFDLCHPDDLDAIATMAVGAVEQADETLNSPAAARFVEFPMRALNGAGSWVSCQATGRLLDRDGTMLGVIRQSNEAQALDAVISGLGSGVDLDPVLSAVIDLARAQFKVEWARVIHDLDGHLDVVGGGDDRNTRDTALMGRMVTEARSTLESHVKVLGGTWLCPVLSETGETLFGLLELPARRPEGPSLLDVKLLGRLTNLASIAFARRRDDKLLADAATTDFLTGVANRRHFESCLARAALLPGGLPFTLLFLDVDDFKSVNDTYGHKVGDEVLAAVAGRLRNAVRPGDIVGRLGGDEFAIGAPGLSGDDADLLLERVQRILAPPVAVTDRLIDVSASIGVAMAVEEDALESILERGDDDMFIRKRRRNRDSRSIHLR